MTQGKRELHQLVHTLSYGDAISGEVLALQRSFKDLGYQSEIFAINVHPKLKGMAKDYQELEEDYSGGILLHYSLGSPLNSLYLSLDSAKRSLIYHNLTPPKWFAGVNPRIVEDINVGVKELPVLCSKTDCLIADSGFNAGELKKLGFSARVLELPIDPEKWNIEANPGIQSLVTGEGGIHVLHVGRLAPNKCVEDIIKIFYFLHHKINKHSKLWLVGIDIDTELYSFSLKWLVDELDLTDSVQFVGCLADSELKSLYQTATAYLCMSEHEGFCLPVIEAMNFDLPVIAYASSALPDTVGGGGVLVKEKRLPEIAELINRIYLDQGFKERLVEGGRERVKELNFDTFEGHVEEIFGRA